MIPPSQNPILLFISTYSNLNSSFDDNFSLPIRLLSPIFFSFLFSFLFLSFHSFDPRLKSLPIFHSIDLKATRIFASFPRSEVFSLINGYEIPNCGHILSGMELSTKMRLLATQLESRLVSHTRYISLSLSYTHPSFPTLHPFFPYRDPRRLAFFPLISSSSWEFSEICRAISPEELILNWSWYIETKERESLPGNCFTLTFPPRFLSPMIYRIFN